MALTLSFPQARALSYEQEIAQDGKSLLMFAGPVSQTPPGAWEPETSAGTLKSTKLPHTFFLTVGVLIMVAGLLGCAGITQSTQSAAPPPVSGAVLTFGASSLSLGQVPVGSTGNSRSLTLSNTGTVSATISQAVISGTGFSMNGLTIPFTLAAVQSITFNVVFAPQTVGSV